MAKGEDALVRKKQKKNRKKMRSSESAVSARIAAVIASKRRRKAGKRRMCEGMCFSLPTLDDPFNDRRGKKAFALPDEKPPTKTLHETLNQKRSRHQALENAPKQKPIAPDGQPPVKKRKALLKKNGDELEEDGGLSKFLVLCLNTIQSAWKEEEDEERICSESVDRVVMASKWGVEFWRRCSAGLNIVDASGACATREQLAWLLSTASDLITRKEKKGHLFSGPVLLFLVPTQEKAAQIRSACKPLKAIGIHTVSLHSGTSIDRQIHGLKSCEPEFLISTPDRLLELVSQQAIDISSISLLILDGLKSFIEFSFLDKVKSIRESISGEPQMVVFSDCYEEASMSLVQHLFKGPVFRSSLYDSIASRSAFVSQYVHIYTSEDEKIPKTLQILTQAFENQKLSQHLKVLLIAGSNQNAQMLASKLKDEGYAISDDSLDDDLHGADRDKASTVFVRDIESVLGTNVEEFEILLFVEFPSIENYVGILTKIARYTVAGAVHSFFCNADAPLAKSLIEVLEQCGQAVPENLRIFASS